MANILTATEAQNFLRLDSSHPVVTLLLPVIDAVIKAATGVDWAADGSSDQLAKSAAYLLLVPWFENPLQMGDTAMGGRGFDLVIGQLQAKALLQKESMLPIDDLALVGSFPSDGMDDVAVAVAPRLVFNHTMAAGATSAITLETAAGAPVSATKTLDTTKKLITVTPAAALSTGTEYVLHLDGTADEYGGTLSDEISFTTVE